MDAANSEVRMLLITEAPLKLRVRSEYARCRLTEAAYDAALDALHPALHEVTSADERSWLREALAGPLALAVEAALDVLVTELGHMVDDAPPALRRKIEQTPRWRTPGWE
jgi:hypothetical protein